MKNIMMKNLLVILISMMLVGCQSSVTKEKKNIVADALLEAEKSSDVAEKISEDEIMQGLLPPAILTLSPQIESRFDVAVKDVSAEKFFFGLVDDSPYNIVLAPGVEGKITLNLKNVSIDQVMNIVRDVYGYEYNLKDGIYTVLPIALRTEIFSLDYINLKRVGSSSITVSAGQVNNNNTSGGIQSSSQNQPQSSNNNQGQTATGTKIETSTEADLWSELEETLMLLVADSVGSQIKVSPHAGIVVARAKPQALRMVKKYLNITENTLSRQVILEAKILEVQLNDGHQAGVDWSSFGSVNGNNVLNLSQAGQIISSSNLNDPLRGAFSLLYQKDDFNTLIELLDSQGNVQVLSSPRISTINNQKAVIKVGTDEFFVTDVSTTTVAGTASSTVTPDVTLTPFFSGIALDVTPQISEDGEIILHIHPTVSEVEDQTKVINLGESDFTLPLALSTIRESDSIVKARSGQVIVIGGLMQEKEILSENSTPLISEIPLVGGLFKQTDNKIVKSELVILLRAQVVGQQTWQQEIEKARKRIELIKR